MAERTSALIDDVHDQEVETSTSPKPPPDGGFKAWLQVVGSFFLFFNSWYNLFFVLRSPSLTVYQGHHQHIRRLSNVLSDHSPQDDFPIEYFLAGFNPSLSLTTRRGYQRTTL